MIVLLQTGQTPLGIKIREGFLHSLFANEHTREDDLSGNLIAALVEDLCFGHCQLLAHLENLANSNGGICRNGTHQADLLLHTCQILAFGHNQPLLHTGRR